MGMIGRWIDSLTDEQRDRIIEHPYPTYDGSFWRDGDCGCLVGCTVPADGWVKSTAGHYYPAAFVELVPSTYPWNLGDLVPRIDYDHPDNRVGCRFPELTERFTPERMWRVCKARAAKANRISLPTPEKMEAAQ